MGEFFFGGGLKNGVEVTKGTQGGENNERKSGQGTGCGKLEMVWVQMGVVRRGGPGHDGGVVSGLLHSFRTKLILAMSLVVAGVTGAAIYLTNHRVEAVYRDIYRQQFAEELDYFTSNQQARLEQVQELCKEVAALPALSEALANRESNAAYTIACDGLKAVIESEMGPVRPEKPSGRPGEKLSEKGRDALLARLRRAPLVRLLDDKGQELTPMDDRVGLRVNNPLGKARARELRKLMEGKLAGPLTEQEVGYMAATGEAEKPGEVPFREFIITPVRAMPDAPLVGALMLAVRLPDLGEKALVDFVSKTNRGKLYTGLWIDGTIYTKSIPAESRQALASRVGRALAVPDPVAGQGAEVPSFEFQIDGKRYLCLWRVLNNDSPFGEACHVCLFSMENAVLEQKDLIKKTMVFGAVALLGSLVVVFLLSHGLTIPIRELVKGTKEIRRGNFEVTVPVRSKDEVGELTASFNEMTAGLAQNVKYRTLLAQVADRDVAEALMSGGGQLGGERREVSVLFCDIRGFTSLTQDLPAEQVVALLNEHMTAMTRVIYEHHGVVDKFVGDLVMAIFGAPTSRGQDALLAARCALKMQTERLRLNEGARHPLLAGIGVATGPVVAGCMGSQDRLDYTVLGERVNLASRLCSKAEGGEVLIDDRTREILGAAAVTEALEPMVLKGFAGPVMAWRIRGLED